MQDLQQSTLQFHRFLHIYNTFTFVKSKSVLHYLSIIDHSLMFSVGLPFHETHNIKYPYSITVDNPNNETG